MTTQRATSASWSHDEFDEGTELPWHGGTFTKEEFAVLALGLIPDEMEDRWFIYMQELTMFVVGSWNGFTLYRVQFSRVDDDIVVAHAEVRRSAGGDLEWHSRLLNYLIRRALLGDVSVTLP